MATPKNATIRDLQAEAIRQITADIEARKRTLEPATNGRLGAVLARSAYAAMKRLALSRWGSSTYFPRSMSHVYPIEVIDFLKIHIALARRAEEERYTEYQKNFSNWVRICAGRIPVRQRRYLGSDYRASVELRSLEQEWGRLGGCPLSDADIFEEMDIARFRFPEAKNWYDLKEFHALDPGRIVLAHIPPEDEYRFCGPNDYVPEGYQRGNIYNGPTERDPEEPTR